ncbi:hypothetical protein CMEL01_06410 [Colletotrichum melonis]|uniref:Uncharacterized protein n=1 Tax=Colletotrichum melonis TaxID=1209925 RepID=A0AAI9U544_9PEZI|nr:hypothetical protein CMEL01_06410 [Colletotrichum melonis]
MPKNGFGPSRGPVCLGHLITDLRHLDNVINRDGPLDIPPNMPIHSSKGWGLNWQIHTGRGAEVSATAGAPIAAAAGVTIKLDAGLAFEMSVRKHWEFEALETFIVQPTNNFVEESVGTTEVLDHLKKQGWLKTSTLFMITGIAIARGASIGVSQTATKKIVGGPGIEAPLGIAEVGFQVGCSKDNAMLSSTHRSTDFVWAVRLAKISKGFIDRKWSFETLSRGATFGRRNNGGDIGDEVTQALRDEGLDMRPCLVNINDDVFVLNHDGLLTSGD